MLSENSYYKVLISEIFQLTVFGLSWPQVAVTRKAEPGTRDSRAEKPAAHPRAVGARSHSLPTLRRGRTPGRPREGSPVLHPPTPRPGLTPATARLPALPAGAQRGAPRPPAGTRGAVLLGLPRHLSPQ